MYEWVIRITRLKYGGRYVWMRHGARMDELCRTDEWVMSVRSKVWMSHVTHSIAVACDANECSRSCTNARLHSFTFVNELSRSLNEFVNERLHLLYHVQCVVHSMNLWMNDSIHFHSHMWINGVVHHKCTTPFIHKCEWRLGARVKRGCTRFQIPCLLCLKDMDQWDIMSHGINEVWCHMGSIRSVHVHSSRGLNVVVPDFKFHVSYVWKWNHFRLR